MKSDCTILILTYKGKHHLEYLLPTVKTTIDNTSEYKFDVLIVDNGCDNKTKEFVVANFPEYRYEFSSVNEYLFSLNYYVKHINTEFVFILNDDMRLHTEVLNETIPVILADNELFAVTCNVRDWDNLFSTAYPRQLSYRRGWLSSKWVKENYESGLKYTLYAGGGAAVFRTKIFNKLKGFNYLFKPAYVEDLDLGHTAWQAGYKIVYNPNALLMHREGGTIQNQFKADILSQKIYKNQILWMVKNCTYPYFLFWFLILLPYRLLISRWKLNKNTHKALLKSLKQIPKALILRYKKNDIVYKDKELMKILNTEYIHNVKK